MEEKGLSSRGATKIVAGERFETDAVVGVPLLGFFDGSGFGVEVDGVHFASRPHPDLDLMRWSAFMTTNAGHRVHLVGEVATNALYPGPWSPLALVVTAFPRLTEHGVESATSQQASDNNADAGERRATATSSGGEVGDGQTLTIHGVHAGMTVKELKAALGPPQEMDRNAEACELGKHTGYIYKGPNGTFMNVRVCKGMGSRVEYLFTDLTDWKTPEGIGINSTKAEVIKAYPHAICDGDDDGQDRGCLSALRCSLHGDTYLDFFIAGSRVLCAQTGITAP